MLPVEWLCVCCIALQFRTKLDCLQLEADGFPCTSISGELDRDKRDVVIKEFRTGITKVLIATDVLSRGFDVQQVAALPPAAHY